MASRMQRGGIEVRHLLHNRKEFVSYLSDVVVALMVTSWLCHFVGESFGGASGSHLAWLSKINVSEF
ncbi:hypothetical protein [Streptomyces anandii]|uniref:hypothetical protein n=1 Tax=Streptomyces anandii TaxID=285454 RepID=UPI0036ACD540